MRVTVAAAGCALLVAACGSLTTHGNGRAAAALDFAKCMRAHGLPNFPDPSGGGGGIQIPDGVNPASPAFQTAQKACGKLLPGGPFRGQATAAEKQQMLQMSECMRAHGLVNFPDPVSKPPSPTGRLGIAFGRPGSFIAVPQSMINSPGFNQAASTCGFPGAGHLRGGKGPKAAVLKP